MNSQYEIINNGSFRECVSINSLGGIKDQPCVILAKSTTARIRQDKTGLGFIKHKDVFT